MVRIGAKRTQYEIYWEILTYCKTPRIFTSIIQRCDLNSKNGQEHLDFLERKGYITRISEGGRTLYSSTQDAKEFIELFTRLYLELYEDSPEFKI
ncbi:MAG: winged helix-turn-helix domain-containing protein [Candidatus Methanosuratincola sp.]|jgi:predicted transcriptional regulator|nr:winged helix-turn-helix domain-containing protein [Candidatus Methanosuratincola sp.]